MRLGPAWRTPEGIGVGSTLEDLEKAIGPFNVLGFGWDYGGTVMLEGTQAEAANGMLFYRLAPAMDSLNLSPEYARVRGDNPYASNSADVRALRLEVRSIDIMW